MLFSRSGGLQTAGLVKRRLQTAAPWGLACKSSINWVDSGKLDSSDKEPSLARRLGPFDATMIVMGGIIGAGIFVNPSVVARHVDTPWLVLGAWLIGGVIALIGAFVYAELASLRPRVGGQYAYLRDAYHPIVAFLYGWTLLLVVQTGGMAGAAIIFGRYFRELSGLAIPEQVVAAGGLGDSHFGQLLWDTRGKQRPKRIDAHEARRDRVADRRRLDPGRSGARSAMTTLAPAPAGWRKCADRADGRDGSGPLRLRWLANRDVSLAAKCATRQRDLPRGLFIGVAGRHRIFTCLVTYVCLRALGDRRSGEHHRPGIRRDASRLGLSVARKSSPAGSRSRRSAFSARAFSPRPGFTTRWRGTAFSSRRSGASIPRTSVPVVAIVLQGVWAASRGDDRPVRTDPELRRDHRRAFLWPDRRIAPGLSRQGSPGGN